MASNQTLIELSVRVTDGSFETKLSVPVSATKEQIDGFTKMWLEQLGHALKINQESAP